MRFVEFCEGALQVDATVVADGLGVSPPVLMRKLRDGEITSVCERGIDDDEGRHRLTFRTANRRFRIIVDTHGTIVRKSTINFSDENGCDG
jgi:hypothetical protein